MKTKQKYDKETLRQYSWIQLSCLQDRIAAKTTPVCVINICLSITSIFIETPWYKWSILSVTTALTTWLAIWLVRYIRIDRIMEEK